MYIIGLHNDIDPGCCLLKDGIILDAISEERLNRTKMFQGRPELSFQYLLDKHSLEINDIDAFAYGWHGRQNDYVSYTKELADRICIAVENDPASSDIIRQRLDTEHGRDAETRADFEVWANEIGIPENKIIYLDHHTSHAYSAFSCSPFEEAFIFSFDGRGDLKSGAAFLATKDEGVKEYNNLLSFDSLGFLYGQITYYLGYIPHRHEGKVTGLAANGNPDATLPLFERMIRWEDNTIRANLGFYKPFYTNLAPELVAELDKHSTEDIAAGVQEHADNLVTQYIRHWMSQMDKPSVRNVCLAGGLFANVRINQSIAELDGVDSVFVFPHMGDGGLPLGSACYARHVLTGDIKVDLPTAYLGAEYSEAEVESVVKSYGERLKFTHLDDTVGSTVADLRAGMVVGYFAGRMEYGPRALGARSILYHTRDHSVNDWLNGRLHRTEFMPFAPVTPEEFGAECYVGWNKDDVASHFMTKTYHCTPSFAEIHPAVVHVDGTARPQIVNQRNNGDYYNIVKTYCDETGERALVNTSFNMHEEPIVCSPKDAIESLLLGTVDVLVIEGFRVEVASK